MSNNVNDFHRFFGAMDLFRNRMNNLFEDFDRSANPALAWVGEATFPRTNFTDKGDVLELVAEIPGMSKDQVQVKLQGNYLQISGSRACDAPEGFQAARNERAAGNFSRSFTLPYEVDSSKASATMKDGLLKLSMPKAENAKPRQIVIQ